MDVWTQPFLERLFCLRPWQRCPRQLHSQSTESTYFLNRWENTLAKVLKRRPSDLSELPGESPSAYPCCDPLTGSDGVTPLETTRGWSYSGCCPHVQGDKEML